MTLTALLWLLAAMFIIAFGVLLVGFAVAIVLAINRGMTSSDGETLYHGGDE